MDEYVKRQLSSVPGHIGFYYKNLVTGETDGSRTSGKGEFMSTEGDR